MLDLDCHVKIHDILQARADGSIDHVYIDQFDKANQSCPVCKEIFSNISRYSIITDLRNLSENVARLISVIGHKISVFGKRLSYHETLLRDTFTGFLQEIRPNPLSAPMNRQMIQERCRGLAEVQADITETKGTSPHLQLLDRVWLTLYQEKLVVPIENNLSSLQKSLNNDLILGKFNFQFKLRFDLLFYRCRHSFLAELLRISKFLITLEDPSYQTRILAESLRRTVIVHATENIDGLHSGIAECEPKFLACLEVEMRLLQLSFYCLMKKATRLSCLQSTDSGQLSSILGTEISLQDRKDQVQVRLDTDASLKRAFSLCRRFPRTAGNYRQQAEALEDSICTSLNPGPIFTAETRVVEQAWQGCRFARLSRCNNHHLYPTANFEDCPECGVEKSAPEEPDYEQYLFEDNFLNWMRNR
jgi:hypothetical protein